VLNKLTKNPKQLFLIDAIGALVSAFFLGVVLVQFESSIGMPRNILYLLALLPCFFAAYSFLCHFLIHNNWRTFLMIIALANTSYCILTIGLLIVHYRNLTILGLLYFLLELLIVGILITAEIRASSEGFDKKIK